MGDDGTRWFLLRLRIPGWALVRWTFNFINKQEGKTIIEVIKEVKKARSDIENS